MAGWRDRWRPRRIGSAQADIDRELQSHLDLEIEEQRDAGLPPEAARQAALRAFGNPAVVREEVRDVWIWHWLLDFVMDIRYACRRLSREATLSLTIIALLALGVGANTAIFSVLDRVV